MADVRLLIPGEAIKRIDGWTSSPNTTMIRDHGKRILVDPGNHPGIIELLEMRSIWAEEIDVVFLTHYHLDHTLNASQFPYAEVMDVKWRYNGNDVIEHHGTIRDTSVRIIPTPGHTIDCSTLLVPTREGVSAVCGDLFWFQKDDDLRLDPESLLHLPDELAFDQELLIESRARILQEADIIIPGHGPMIRVSPDQ